MARQINPEISLEQFSEICMKPARIYNGYKVVSRTAMIKETQEIMQLRGEKNISMKKIVSNAISQETAEEDFKKVEKIVNPVRTDDKKISEGEVKND